MARNNYAKQIQNIVQAKSQHRVDTYCQMCFDVALMAAHDVFGMGEGRCKEFSDVYNQYMEWVVTMTEADRKDDKEIWYTKAKIDELLKKICGKYFVPWEERYARKLAIFGCLPEAKPPEGQA